MMFFRNRWLQLSALSVLLASIGIFALRLKCSVLDYDIWWHLKVGDWIVDNLSLPHSGIPSRTAAARPWVAYSWGYEVLLSRAYAWFGLVGIGAYGTLLTMGVAASIYWMLRRLSGGFWFSCLLAGIVCSAFLFNGMPRPVFFSMILFCVMLTLLFEAQRSGRIRPLYWLPALFLLWANLHIQFVYGLFVVALPVAVNLAQTLLQALGFASEFLSPPTLPAKPLSVILALCVVAV
jgi:hypothetical protein